MNKKEYYPNKHSYAEAYDPKTQNLILFPQSGEFNVDIADARIIQWPGAPIFGVCMPGSIDSSPSETYFGIDGQPLEFVPIIDVSEATSVSPTECKCMTIDDNLRFIVWISAIHAGKRFNFNFKSKESTLHAYEANILREFLLSGDFSAVYAAMGVSPDSPPAKSLQVQINDLNTTSGGQEQSISDLQDAIERIDEKNNEQDGKITSLENSVSSQGNNIAGLTEKTQGIEWVEDALDGKTRITGGLYADKIFTPKGELEIREPIIIKWARLDLSRVIAVGADFNIMSVLPEAPSVVAGINPALFAMLNKGTATAALKFPAFSMHRPYVIAFRGVGTIAGPSGTPREWVIELRRGDGTLVAGSIVAKVSGASVENRETNFTSYTLSATDPFSVLGIRIVINNKAAGGADITLTGFEFLITSS